jgi:serralysin
MTMAKFWYGTDDDDQFTANTNETWYIYGYDGDDDLYGAGGGDRLYGGYGHDYLNGGGGADYLYGSYGNDVLVGGSGSDYLSGGTGTDWAYYSGSTGVVVDLEAGAGYGGEAAGDTLLSIENVRGTSHSDVLFGNDGANALYGGSGEDVLHGGAGADTLFGGLGADTASYDESPTGVYVNLPSGLVAGGDANGDVLLSIEDLIGSAYEDVLRGNDADNNISARAGFDSVRGGDGDDTISGGADNDFVYGDAGDDKVYGDAGDDWVYGGEGTDTLTGGTGTDTFVFNSQLNWFTNVDTITDFDPATETIELSSSVFTELDWGALDADAFHIGSVAADAEDRIMYDPETGSLSYDADGAGGAWSSRFAYVDENLPLTASDFLVG